MLNRRQRSSTKEKIRTSAARCGVADVRFAKLRALIEAGEVVAAR